MDRAREFRNFLPITLPNCADPTRALYLLLFLVPSNQNETQSNMNSIEVFAKYRAMRQEFCGGGSPVSKRDVHVVISGAKEMLCGRSPGHNLSRNGTASSAVTIDNASVRTRSQPRPSVRHRA